MSDTPPPSPSAPSQPLSLRSELPRPVAFAVAGAFYCISSTSRVCLERARGAAVELLPPPFGHSRASGSGEWCLLHTQKVQHTHVHAHTHTHAIPCLTLSNCVYSFFALPPRRILSLRTTKAPYFFFCVLFCSHNHSILILPFASPLRPCTTQHLQELHNRNQEVPPCTSVLAIPPPSHCCNACAVCVS